MSRVTMAGMIARAAQRAQERPLVQPTSSARYFANLGSASIVWKALVIGLQYSMSVGVATIQLAQLSLWRWTAPASRSPRLPSWIWAGPGNERIPPTAAL